MRNVGKKHLKPSRKKIIGQANNYTPAFGPTHNFKRTQSKSKGQLEMMSINEWWCNLYEIFF
jgi:hypothetical protein